MDFFHRRSKENHKQIGLRQISDNAKATRSSDTIEVYEDSKLKLLPKTKEHPILAMSISNSFVRKRPQKKNQDWESRLRSNHNLFQVMTQEPTLKSWSISKYSAIQRYENCKIERHTKICTKRGQGARASLPTLNYNNLQWALDKCN